MQYPRYELNGAKFSTMDRDNDVWSKDCSAKHGNSGWWFSKCMAGNLNGINFAANTIDDNGIYWHTFENSKISLKTVTMSILPKNV